MVPAQQPVGHEVASHWHMPLLVLHSSPAGQAAQFAPWVPHWPLDSEA